MYIPRTAATEFFGFVSRYDPESDRKDPDWTPYEYLLIWLEQYGGIEFVSGNFKIYLKAVAFIVQECYYNPSVLDFHYTDGHGIKRTVARRPRYVSFEKAGTFEGDRWADEDYFNSLVFSYWDQRQLQQELLRPS